MEPNEGKKGKFHFCFACLLIRETMFQRCGLLVFKAVSTTVRSYIPVNTKLNIYYTKKGITAR
jgi:hypothetical protein